MRSITPANFYVFRKPSFSVETAFNLLSCDSSKFEQKLKHYFLNAELQEGIYLSSPELYHCLQEWLGKVETSKNEKLLSTLLKYLIRSCTRPTPFGTFSGCMTAGSFSQNTCTTFKGEQPFKKYDKIEFGNLTKITSCITNDPAIYQQLKYYPNSSLYKLNDNYKYFYYNEQEGNRHYSLCSLGCEEYLEKILSFSKEGKYIKELSASIVTAEIDFEVAENYILELIREQVLVCELETRVTGKYFLETLLEKVSTLTGTEKLSEILKEASKLLKNQESILEKEGKIKNLIQAHFFKTTDKPVINTDLVYQADNTIGNDAIKNLTKTFSELTVLDQGNYNAHLIEFKKKFYERYEEQEIPLLQALDHQEGIGYGDTSKIESSCLPLFEDTNLLSQEKKTTIEWNAWKDFILKKYSEVLISPTKEILLSEEDLNSLKATQNNEFSYPSSFAAFGNFLAKSDEDIDKGNFSFLLNQISGPSGANMIARFCHADPALERYVKSYLDSEEHRFPDCLLAEVVHLPELLAGNIIQRPTFRKYEIPFLSESSVEKEFQIPLNDLMISLKGGKEIILRSKKFNKRVIPRNTASYNYRRGLGIYNFLCDLQFDQKFLNIKWHWSILENQFFLPRVSYKNIILSRASWYLKLAEIPEIKKNKHLFQSLFSDIKKKHNIPRYVSLCENDNELLLDLENEYSLKILAEEFIKREGIRIKEYLLSPENCFIKDERGSYTNEIIIPFESNETSLFPSKTSSKYTAEIKRKFAIGSEWIYFKIYGGEKILDTLLATELRNITSGLIEDGVVNKWFFCRFTDPDFHLRIRFQGDVNKGFYKEVIERIYKGLNSYLESKSIFKIQTDTYNREIERYGEKTIEPCEDIFFYDSNSTVQFLELMGEDPNENLRWLFALTGVDKMMDDFELPLNKKAKLIESLHESFGVEFKSIPHLKKQADAKYRKHSRMIEDVFRPDLNSTGVDFEKILEQRSYSNKKTIKSIIERNLSNETMNESILISCIHMFLNRLFIAQPRLQEYFIYHHLLKYYKSLLGKQKQSLDSSKLLFEVLYQ